MATLLLMRHAKSSWDDAGCPDHARPLNPRGRRDAPRMGRWLISQGYPPGRIVTSSAHRARETAELVATASDPPPPIEVRDDLYHATVEHLAAVLPPLALTGEHLLVIGHNPGLEGLLREWTGEAVRLPTAAVARLKVDFDETTGRWRIKLKEVWRPKDLSPEPP
jgi:phosphohistidine phosphatase